ncbi:hypothetical protein GF359_09765 [candidate division WOR-3 bacterium]|uniref:Uncharacterized protein n=1 Tax=candidate division WOR-3 bacterium TaxID=2052148 RepID=A0A9D5QDX0_UNCW3|nr:hypothetical protein [candidate division WOR-3 bacterium]MBD3365486.1 hypothetical protein [candidate division WOR-3 bacterium]
MKARNSAINILLNEACVPIRWRVEREILGKTRPETVTVKELLEYPRVQENFDYLTGKADFDSIHSSFKYIFENVCGSLHDLGIRQGMDNLDQRIKPYLDRLDYLVNSTDHGENLYTGFLGKEFQASIIAGSVSLIGYHKHPVVRKHVKARLARLAEFKPHFDLKTIYSPDPKGYPKLWRDKFPFLNPEHYASKRFHLPWIHDLDCWGSLPLRLHTMADEVATWIMTDDYQSLPDGYGVIATAPRRYYAMGWSIKLPGWTRDFNPRYAGMMFQYMEALAPFKSAANHPWFRKALDWFEGFVDDDGLFQLPKESLKETGYWVGGGLPAIELKPRTYRKRVLEATFRLLTLKRIIDG